jgi:hypothetical protein
MVCIISAIGIGKGQSTARESLAAGRRRIRRIGVGGDISALLPIRPIHIIIVLDQGNYTVVLGVLQLTKREMIVIECGAVLNHL